MHCGASTEVPEEQTGIRPAVRARPAVLARESGCSRQHLLRLRKGKMEPTRRVMVALAQACSRRLSRPVRVAEVFDIGERDDVPRAAPPRLRS